VKVALRIFVLLLTVAAVLLRAQNRSAVPSDRPDTPFKLANLEGVSNGKPAIVVKDRIYDLQRANEFVTQQARLTTVAIPLNNIQIIEQYDRVKARLYQIANFLASSPATFGTSSDSTRFVAPLLYPWNIIAVAVNYRAHGAEMNRNLAADYDKDPPFVFAKSPKATLNAPGAPVIIPEGRDRIDWEIELAAIVGKKSSNVKSAQAEDYLWGFGLILDISDRGGQTRKDPLFNADWFSGKSRDGFAPMGATIVPKEFLKNYQNVGLKLAVNGQVMQESNTSYMVHNVRELLQFITSVQTLEPGDIIATGTPEGVGNGRKPPVFLKRGDVITAEIEGVGSIRTPVK